MRVYQEFRIIRSSFLSSSHSMSSYQALPKKLFNQSVVDANLCQDFRNYTSTLSKIGAELAQIKTLAKGLETNANMVAIKNSKGTVTLSASDKLLFDQFFKSQQILIPNLNQAPTFALKKADFTLAEAVSINGIVESAYNDLQMKMSSAEGGLNQIFQNSRRALSYINTFEKKSSDMKNDFTTGFRG